MAIPDVYGGANVLAASTPTITNGNMSPLQLALLAAMSTGNPPPFGPNYEFMLELKKFGDSGIVAANVLYKDTVGANLVSIGDEIYMLRQAEDCGPDDKNRTEQVYLGRRADIAFGTFAHYGPKISGGTLCTGTSVGNSSGGDGCGSDGDGGDGA